MRLSELQSKDIISVNDGKKIGNIIDINIDNNGKLDSLIVEKSKFIISRFSTSNDRITSYNVCYTKLLRGIYV